MVDEWIMEIGGGLNFERKRFLRLVDAIVEGEVSMRAHRPSGSTGCALALLCSSICARLTTPNWS